MIAIWSWLTHTWNTLALFIARDWLFYIITVPVVATIAYGVARAIPAERQGLTNDEEEKS